MLWAVLDGFWALPCACCIPCVTAGVHISSSPAACEQVARPASTSSNATNSAAHNRPPASSSSGIIGSGVSSDTNAEGSSGHGMGAALGPPSLPVDMPTPSSNSSNHGLPMPQPVGIVPNTANLTASLPSVHKQHKESVFSTPALVAVGVCVPVGLLAILAVVVYGACESCPKLATASNTSAGEKVMGMGMGTLAKLGSHRGEGSSSSSLACNAIGGCVSQHACVGTKLEWSGTEAELQMAWTQSPSGTASSLQESPGMDVSHVASGAPLHAQALAKSRAECEPAQHNSSQISTMPHPPMHLSCSGTTLGSDELAALPHAWQVRGFKLAQGSQMQGSGLVMHLHGCHLWKAEWGR